MTMRTRPGLPSPIGRYPTSARGPLERVKERLRSVPTLRRLRLDMRRKRREIYELRLVLFPTRKQSGQALLGQPFNGQAVRTRTVRALLDAFDPDAVIETGTFLGSTTRFFAGNLVPVYSVEIKRLYHMVARVTLGRCRDVTLIRGSSPEVLERMARQRRFKKPLAYLDAHWWGHLPLQGEIDQLLSGWDEAVIVIDDCKVPGDGGYGFDVYSGVPLSLDMLEIPDDVLVAFPAVPSSKETGGKRGTLYLAKGRAGTDALRRLSTRGLLSVITS